MQNYLCRILFCCATALASGSLVASESYRLILANESGDAASPMGQSMEEMARLLLASSNGRISSRVFHRGELGGQQEMFDHLLKGTVHIMLAWPGTSYDKRLGAIYMPYLVLGWQDAIAAYSEGGWLKTLLDPVFLDNGLKFFGPYPEGFGGIASKGRYATSFEQAAGLKVRSQPIFPLPQTVQAMGFEAVPIDWNEVYTSIQTGVVDGDSSNVIYWDYEYFGDLLDYFVHSKHNFSAFMLMMNLEVFDSLSEADQELIKQAAEQIVTVQFAAAKAEDQKWIRTAQDNGMQYIVPAEKDMAAWVKRVRAQVWPMAQAAVGAEIMSKVRDNASVPGE